MIASACFEGTYEGPAGGAAAEATISLELRAGLSPQETDRRIAQGARAGDVGARVLAYYLADMADRGAHQALGFHSVSFYAERRYHMRPATTREYVAVGRALQELPAIDEAFCRGRLLYSQVRELVRVATPETEDDWVEFAEKKTARELAGAVRIRARGERPTDPARRRIHATRFNIGARVDVVQWERWNTARAKLEAEEGRPLSDVEMMDAVATLLLETRPDGSVPGRTPVNDSHYRVIVVHERDSGRTILNTAEGPVELASLAAAAILLEAGREDLASDIDENSGPLVPPELRDAPTTPEMRRQILARDRFRCLCCGGRDNLTIHHKRMRRYGGRTVPRNLFTFCDDCHSLTHDGLIIVRGTVPGGLRFLGPDGQELSGRVAVDALLLTRTCDRHEQGAARAAGGEVAARAADDRVAARAAGEQTRSCGFPSSESSLYTLDALPQQVDAQWWSRHGHLLRWDDRSGTLEFQPGCPLADVAARAAAREPAARAAGHPKLADMVGQERVVNRLRRAVDAAALRGVPVAHILMGGPPGLGKTTLAQAVASEVGTGFHRVAAPVIKEPAVLLRLLTCLGERDVLFIDEIHRLPPAVAEALYEAMAENSLSLPVRCGSQQRTLHVHLVPFTLIGATTEEDLLPEALRSRFLIREHMEFYRHDELAVLLHRAASGMGLQIDPSAAGSLAAAARESPREALALLSAARDEIAISGGPTIDAGCADAVLAALGIDADGLRPLERRYLETLARARGPLGLSTLAGRLGVSRATLQRVCEPYLLRRGLIEMTRFGRVLSAA